MARTAQQQDLIDRTKRSIGAIRAARPHVHCLTNSVAQSISANVLLAIGAEPSMTVDAGAIGDFVQGTDALVVNLGMLDQPRIDCIPVAIAHANKLGRPWLLDPVKVDRAPSRLCFAQQLLVAQPSTVRCNRREHHALRQDLMAFSGVVAVTGPRDRIIGDKNTIELGNGDPLMDRVTAMGCAASALIGAFLAVDQDPWFATACGLIAMGVAGTLAAEHADGPGSFEVALLDRLFALSDDQIDNRAIF